MPALWEIAVLIASLAMVVVAIAVVRASRSVERVADQVTRLSEDLHEWVAQTTALTTETREVVASVREMTGPIRRVVDRFEVLGERAARLSTVVLEEVAPPIQTVAAITRGVRSIAAVLMNRLSHRFMTGRSAAEGGLEP